MGGIAEQKWQIEHVEIVDHRADSADTHTRELQGADLRLFDCLLFAAELHRGEYLDGEPAIGRRFELFAEALHRGDGRVAGRMNVGRFECRLHKRRDWRASGERERAGQGCGAAKNITSAHYFLPEFPETSGAHILRTDRA